NAVAAILFERPRHEAGFHRVERAAVYANVKVPVANARDAERRPGSPSIFETRQHGLRPARRGGLAIGRKLAVNDPIILQRLDTIHLIPPGDRDPDDPSPREGQLAAHEFA